MSVYASKIPLEELIVIYSAVITRDCLVITAECFLSEFITTDAPARSADTGSYVSFHESFIVHLCVEI